MDYFKLLDKSNYELLVVKNKEVIIKKNGRGIKPLYELYNEYGQTLSECIIVDKIIGKGAAYILAMMEVSQVFTPIISKGALEILQYKEIHITYKEEVEYIINRMGNDLCPVEKMLIDVTDEFEAIKMIETFLKKLSL